jgi:hypothetical protein
MNFFLQHKYMILYLSFPPAITENNVRKSECEKNTILWPGFPSLATLPLSCI